MAASVGQSLRVFRGILKELKQIHGKERFHDVPAYLYVVDQFRKYQVTSEKICRGQTEMQHMAETYLCLLQSIRKYEEVLTIYKGRGERDIESSANLVGLTLPNNYEPVSPSEPEAK